MFHELLLADAFARGGILPSTRVSVRVRFRVGLGLGLGDILPRIATLHDGVGSFLGRLKILVCFRFPCRPAVRGGGVVLGFGLGSDL